MAAGDGGRLGDQTINCPKVLLPVNVKSLVSYTIEAMVAAGIGEIAIVIGYLGDKVVEVLGSGSDFGARLHYIFNPDYHGGNAISLYRTRDWVRGDPIVLGMGDHLIERNLVRRLLDRQTFSDTLCVDYMPAPHHQVSEATKVNIDGTGCIRDIGKELVRWNAMDTGIFLLTENFFQAIDKLVPSLGINVEISDAVRFLISQGHCFDTCDVSGYFWADVDTEQDLINMVGEQK